MNHQIFDISCEANQWKGSDAEALIKSWDLDVDKVSYIKRIVRSSDIRAHIYGIWWVKIYGTSLVRNENISRYISTAAKLHCVIE